MPDDGGTNRSDAGPLGDHDASTANDAGSNPPSSECAEDCDDGIDCTADECVNEVCTHAVDAEVCDPGEACDVRGPGCATTTACGNTADCADSDPCTTRVRCNTSLASCEWDILDGDADGHPPQGCGGDDPDDGNTNVRPGATDLCDGEDNDGDGDTDEEPQASASCISGTCPGCSIGCQRYSDVAQLHAPAEALYPGASFFDFVHAVCPTLGPGIPNVCPITSGNDYFSSDCDACLTALAECGEPCPCSGTPDDGCHACLCDLNCVEPFEACSGIDHPAACN